MQVSTAKGSDYKPKFRGPYVIQKLNKDNCTAYIEHMRGGQIIKAHFSNLQKFHFSPKRSPLKTDFDDNLLNQIGEMTK